ncbi:MAG: pyruvate kinase [Clostridiales bacterium]|nr:pyruvate kinase [Clostridiales bacterium]
MRRTKIVCTIGHASDNEQTLREMLLSGMDVARLNFSHGDHESHKHKVDLVRRLSAETGKHTALLLDTKGPEIRVGLFRGGKAILESEEQFIMTSEDILGDNKQVSISYKGLPDDVSPGDIILMDDGMIALKIISAGNGRIVTKVLNGGVLTDRKSLCVPGAHINLDFLSPQDIADLEFGIKEDFDIIAASFTQSAENIRQMRRELEKRHCRDMMIFAKIESVLGVRNIDEIINEADGIMVARGDMGVEIPLENVPIIQKQIIEKCRERGKTVITATQLLESMTVNPRPTRAEVNDVANAIFDGTSAIMLSGETANGRYPVESVKTMARVAERTESAIDYKKRFKEYFFTELFTSVTTAVSHAACTTASDLKATAIIVVSKSGQTARMISRYRPDTPIVGCSPLVKTCRQLNIVWGVTPVLIDEVDTIDRLIDGAVEASMNNSLVTYGDLIVITAGIPIGISGTTNMLKVQIVGNVLINGTGLSPGSVCGNLCVGKNAEELRMNFKEGDIIAIPEVDSSIIDLIRLAGGIITEHGGPESYPAIVGQTLAIPVISCSAGATGILKCGTTVTLDAYTGIVHSNS